MDRRNRMSHDAPAHATSHHVHDFDGEPATQLPADEPRTPSWVPLLGLALFVVVGAALLVRQAGPVRAPEQQAAAAPMQPAAQAAPPAAAPPRPAVAGPQPSGSGRPTMSPDQMRDLQKRVEEARRRRAEAGGTAAPAAPAPAPPR
jgi:hypothetical protein